MCGWCEHTDKPYEGSPKYPRRTARGLVELGGEHRYMRNEGAVALKLGGNTDLFVPSGFSLGIFLLTD